MICLQSNASGSSLQTCINFVEERLKFSHLEGSIILKESYSGQKISLVFNPFQNQHLNQFQGQKTKDFLHWLEIGYRAKNIHFSSNICLLCGCLKPFLFF